MTIHVPAFLNEYINIFKSFYTDMKSYREKNMEAHQIINQCSSCILGEFFFFPALFRYIWQI